MPFLAAGGALAAVDWRLATFVCRRPAYSQKGGWVGWLGCWLLSREWLFRCPG